MLSRWLIANWLSGYYHAKRNNWIVDSEGFENCPSSKILRHRAAQIKGGSGSFC